jgi:hypothetical protein
MSAHPVKPKPRLQSRGRIRKGSDELPFPGNLTNEPTTCSWLTAFPPVPTG